jgi:uncharacterized membrane protein
MIGLMKVQLLIIVFLVGAFVGLGFRSVMKPISRGRVALFQSPLRAEQGIGEGRQSVAAPSKINMLPVDEQQVAVYTVMAGIATSTVFLLLLFSMSHNNLFQFWQGSWPLLGQIFMLAGYSHFTLKKDSENEYPPSGTWGVWELPGSAEFHVWWTGIAEIALGGSLLLGSVYRFATGDESMFHASALALFILTIAITPANLYMYTHGARLPMSQPSPPVIFHYVRFFLQSLLLAMFVSMATS